MKITALETFLTNAGARHYLFVRLTTDNRLQGRDAPVREASASLWAQDWVDQFASK